MKKIVEQVEGEGLEKLLGEQVTLLCANYFYNGRLVGVSSTNVLLENAKIIYDTGLWNADDWALAEVLPGPWYVQIAFIESFGITK